MRDDCSLLGLFRTECIHDSGRLNWICNFMRLFQCSSVMSEVGVYLYLSVCSFCNASAQYDFKKNANKVIKLANEIFFSS